MKQLLGKARPKWLVATGQAIATVVFVAKTASILPVLLIASLLAALLLIPVVRKPLLIAAGILLSTSAALAQQPVQPLPKVGGSLLGY